MSDFPAETIDPPQRDDEITPTQAVEDVVREHYGLSGHARPIAVHGLPEASAYVIDNGHMRYRIDVRTAAGKANLELEAVVLRHLAQKGDAPDAPELVSTRDGLDVVALAQEDGDALRVVTIVDGIALPTSHAPNSTEIAAIGRLAGELSKNLADFADAGLERSIDADLRQAGPVVLRQLGNVTDHAVRDPIAKILVAALRRMQPLAAMLRIQPVHHGLVIEQMTGRLDEDGNWRAEGIVDVGEVVEAWLVGSLAVTCADLLLRGSEDPFEILPAIRAFHEVLPLSEPELRALWPLIVARASVLAASAEHDAATETTESNDESLDTAMPADHSGRRIFAIATDIHPALMEAAILEAVDWDSGDPAIISDDICRLMPEIDTQQVRLVNLAIDSPLLVDGNWADPEIDWRMLARTAWETSMGATRYGEYRLSRSSCKSGNEADNYALHVDICVPAGTVVVAPFGGMLKEVGQQLVLVGRDATLYLEGLVCPLSEGMALFAEDAIGSVAGAEGSVGGLRIRLCRDTDLSPPLFTTPRRAGAWRRLCPSPSQLLGLDVNAPTPKQHELVRGWRAHVYDGLGHVFTDLSGAAGIVGHGHPALAEAAYHQWSLLSGFSTSASEQRFREHMLTTLPQGLDVIAAIGSETEMMALAQTLLRSDEPQEGLFDLEDGDAQTVPAVIRIADERSSGFGRTGHHFWQFEQDAAAPDIVVTGSILPGKPLAVLATRSDLAATLTERPAPAIDAVDYAVAAAALGATRAEGLQQNARIVGNHLRTLLQPVAQEHGMKVEGTGLQFDLIFEEPRASRLAKSLFARGFLTAPINDPQRLTLRPPLCFDITSADALFKALVDSLGTPENPAGITSDEIERTDLLSNEIALPI